MMKKHIDLSFILAYKQYLNKQQISTLKGQVLSGNIDGAKRGLARILRRKGIDYVRE